MNLKEEMTLKEFLEFLNSLDEKNSRRENELDIFLEQFGYIIIVDYDRETYKLIRIHQK